VAEQEEQNRLRNKEKRQEEKLEFDTNLFILTRGALPEERGWIEEKSPSFKRMLYRQSVQDLEEKILENPSSYSKLIKVFLSKPQLFSKKLVGAAYTYDEEQIQQREKQKKEKRREEARRFGEAQKQAQINQTLGGANSEALQQMKARIAKQNQQEVQGQTEEVAQDSGTAKMEYVPTKEVAQPYETTIQNNPKETPQQFRNTETKKVERPFNKIDSRNFERELTPEIVEARGNLTMEATTVYKHALRRISNMLAENFNKKGRKKRILQADKIAEGLSKFWKLEGEEFVDAMRNFYINVLRWKNIVNEREKFEKISEWESKEKRMLDLMPYMRPFFSRTSITDVINAIKKAEENIDETNSQNILSELDYMKDAILSNQHYTPTDEEDFGEYLNQYELKMMKINNLAKKCATTYPDDKDRNEIYKLGEEVFLYDHFLNAHKIYLKRKLAKDSKKRGRKGAKGGHVVGEDTMKAIYEHRKEERQINNNNEK